MQPLSPVFFLNGSRRGLQMELALDGRKYYGFIHRKEYEHAPAHLMHAANKDMPTDTVLDTEQYVIRSWCAREQIHFAILKDSVDCEIALLAEFLGETFRKVAY